MGNVVEVVGHRFLIDDADESTFRLMECDEKTFPYSDLASLQSIIASKQDAIKSYFLSRYDGNGLLDLEGLATLCNSVGIALNHAQLVTIFRRISKRNSDAAVPFRKLLKFATEEKIIL